MVEKLRTFKSKIAVGLVAATLVAGVGAATLGTAHATNGSHPTSKAQCKNGGWQNPAWAHLGFRNQGDCVSYVNHLPGYGGSNGNTVNVNANINLNNSNDNIINVIIRIVMGG